MTLPSSVPTLSALLSKNLLHQEPMQYTYHITFIDSMQDLLWFNFNDGCRLRIGSSDVVRYPNRYLHGRYEGACLMP